MEKFICLSNDDSCGQISSLNRVPVCSHLFLYVRRLSSEGKNNTTLRHFCYAELKITGFHCSCMSVTYINNLLFFLFQASVLSQSTQITVTLLILEVIR